MAFDFTGKKVLVTGSGQGIGRGIAPALAKAGCKVYALDRCKETLANLASENSNIVTLLQDLSNWDETRATLEKHEPMDRLVKHAGVFLAFKSALEHTRQELEKNISVNLMAGNNCIEVIGKKIVDAGIKGSVVNISTFGALKAYPGALGNCVSGRD